jgi:hypothetical protein
MSLAGQTDRTMRGNTMRAFPAPFERGALEELPVTYPAGSRKTLSSPCLEGRRHVVPPGRSSCRPPLRTPVVARLLSKEGQKCRGISPWLPTAEMHGWQRRDAANRGRVLLLWAPVRSAR